MSHFLIRCALCCALLTAALAETQAQTFKAWEKAGDKALKNKDVNAAMHHYARALGLNPAHVGLGYKYAGLAQRAHAYEAARDYYLKVTASPEAGVYPQALFQLGMMEKTLGRYDQAASHFRDFIDRYGASDPARKAQAESQLEQCRRAAEMSAQPPTAELVRLGKSVNSAYTEFGPYPAGDTLYFSSLRFDNPKDKNLPPRMVSKVMSSLRSGAGRALKDGFNEDTRHTAHFARSHDGRRVYFTRCDYVNASEIRCALYYREPDRRGRLRTEIRLPDPLHLPGFTATQPAVGYDSLAQKEWLFFVSDRPGGAGGLDIWASEVLAKGAFGTPEPLRNINTPADDITPFFHAASKTLYFSTEGRFSLGGFDIYSSPKTAGGWAEPVHGGLPLNSSFNDIYPVLEQDGVRGYLASNRPGSLYLDASNKTCCNDIYQFRLLPPPADSTIPMEQALIPPPVETPLIAEEEKLPQTLEDFLPLALYFDNDEPDKRTRRTTTQQTYGGSFEKYYVRKQEYMRQYAGELKGDEQQDAEDRMEDFFENDIRRGHDFLIRFSEILLTRLQKGDQVEIFIKGFTSPRAETDYNLNLGKRRISSVRNHFEEWSDGQLKPYLQSGQLVITETSFG
ncbi:MAG TPA: hypothetical protein PK198_01155, partial [Saprospiraceae bacterium]|nr:hypothetical protein [Saprospiraceae bacterium]